MRILSYEVGPYTAHILPLFWGLIFQELDKKNQQALSFDFDMSLFFSLQYTCVFSGINVDAGQTFVQYHINLTEQSRRGLCYKWLDDGDDLFIRQQRKSWWISILWTEEEIEQRPFDNYYLSIDIDILIIFDNKKQKTIDRHISRLWSCPLRPIIYHNNHNEPVRTLLEQRAQNCSFSRILSLSRDERSMYIDPHDLE